MILFDYQVGYKKILVLVVLEGRSVMREILRERRRERERGLEYRIFFSDLFFRWASMLAAVPLLGFEVNREPASPALADQKTVLH